MTPDTGPLRITLQPSTRVASLYSVPLSSRLGSFLIGTLGWRDLVKGGIEIYDTPGHHADLVRDPRARVLAEQLADALAKAHARCRLESLRVALTQAVERTTSH